MFYVEIQECKNINIAWQFSRFDGETLCHLADRCACDRAQKPTFHSYSSPVSNYKPSILPRLPLLLASYGLSFLLYIRAHTRTLLSSLCLNTLLHLSAFFPLFSSPRHLRSSSRLLHTSRDVCVRTHVPVISRTCYLVLSDRRSPDIDFSSAIPPRDERLSAVAIIFSRLE